MKQEITIHVKMDPRQYRRFNNFDTFRLRRRWLMPAVIGLVLILLSVMDLFLVPGTSGTRAGILMGMGIAIPMISFGVYLIQIQVQTVTMHLAGEPEIYVLRFREDLVRVTAGAGAKSSVEIPWDAFLAAYRRGDVIYLYVNEGRAFILPDGQADVSGEALWRTICDHLGEKKCH